MVTSRGPKYATFAVTSFLNGPLIVTVIILPDL